jgi:hypothetical protein
MNRPRIGIVRYTPVIKDIAHSLGIQTAPAFRIGRGRITLIFRQLGASRWPAEERIEYAFHVASVARSMFAADHRRLVRRQANRAIVVVFEDVFLERGCDIAARWQCIIPFQR